MKKFFLKLTFALVICSAATLPIHAQSEGPLTNSSVVKLVRAGFKDKTVIAIIRSRPNRFHLDPDKLIELKRVGVSENIILAMLAQDESFVMAGDEWNDELRLPGTSNDSRGQSSSSDIFGSGSRSRRQSGGRGMGDGNEGETTTTGSATVRILRPPAEAGAARSNLKKLLA